MNVGACGHLDDTTGAVWKHVVFFFLLFFTSEDKSLIFSVVLDSAPTLFTPETPAVFCGNTSPTPRSA